MLGIAMVKFILMNYTRTHARTQIYIYLIKWIRASPSYFNVRISDPNSF